MQTYFLGASKNKFRRLQSSGLARPKFPQNPKIQKIARSDRKEFNIKFIVQKLDFSNSICPGVIESPFLIGQNLEFPGLLQFSRSFFFYIFFTFYLHSIFFSYMFEKN